MKHFDVILDVAVTIKKGTSVGVDVAAAVERFVSIGCDSVGNLTSKVPGSCLYLQLRKCSKNNLLNLEELDIVIKTYTIPMNVEGTGNMVIPVYCLSVIYISHALVLMYDCTYV